MHIGRQIPSAQTIPAVTVELTISSRFAARSLIIMRETVIGIPEAETVIITPTTESAI